MKYLFVILALVILSSAVTLYYIQPEDLSKTQDVAVSINGHQVSRKQVVDQGLRQGYHSGNSEAISINSLVTRQLLLDEAQRLGIDREDEFRKALKDYYEQSLIKVLTDRKLKSVKVTVTDADVDRYLACSGQMMTFTRIPVEGGKVLLDQGRQNSVLFDDLSEPLRIVLASLKPGEKITQFDTGTEVGVILLDKMEKAEGFDPVKYDRDRVRELLSNYQKSLEIDKWINGLRKNASVVVFEEDEKND